MSQPNQLEQLFDAMKSIAAHVDDIDITYLNEEAARLGLTDDIATIFGVVVGQIVKSGVSPTKLALYTFSLSNFVVNLRQGAEKQ